MLTVDLARGRVVRDVPISDDGRIHSPKRMITLDLPADVVAAANREGMTDALQGVGGQQQR